VGSRPLVAGWRRPGAAGRCLASGGGGAKGVRQRGGGSGRCGHNSADDGRGSDGAEGGGGNVILNLVWANGGSK
jgi:hypothetical protein